MAISQTTITDQKKRKCTLDLSMPFFETFFDRGDDFCTEAGYSCAKVICVGRRSVVKIAG